MKLNKKILAVFLCFSLFLSFEVTASAMIRKNVINENKKNFDENKFLKSESFYVAMEYDIFGRGMQKRGKDGVIKYNNSTNAIDAVGLYIVLKKFLEENNLLDEGIKEQILFGIFDVYAQDLRLKAEVDFFFKRFKEVKKLKKAIAKTNFKEIEITNEMFCSAMEEIKNYVQEKSIRKIENKLNAYKNAFEGGDRALVELNIKNVEKNLKHSQKEIKSYGVDSLEYKQLLNNIEYNENILKDLKNETSLTEEKKHQFEIVIKNLEKFLEGAKSALNEIEHVKYENVVGINKALKVEKTLFNLRTHERI